jgi:hypothetical protein
MAEWKKVIVSGSTAALAAANVDGTVTANAFSGDGSNLTNVPAGSINIESFTDGTAVTVLGTDKLIFSDGGDEKFINVSQLFDSADFDSEVTGNSAVTANTAKTGITSGQASAITANTSKTGITSGQASAITANTSKTGITSAQASAITANTSKTGISSAQASAITANTSKATNVSTDLSVSTTSTTIDVESSDGSNATLPVANTNKGGVMSAALFDKVSANTSKTGITSAQASAITANTAKETFPGLGTSSSTALAGDTTTISGAQASAITANTAKTGITSGQASAITANTSKTGITSAQASAITANTSKVTFPGLGTTGTKALAGNTTTISSAQASAITANTSKTGVSIASVKDTLNQDFGSDFTIGTTADDTAIFTGDVSVGQSLAVTKALTCQDLTISGNLDVNGTTTTVDTANLAVADKFIELNRGASTEGDGGIVINGATNKSFGWDDSADRWAFDFTGASASQTTIGADAYVSAVVTTDDSNYRKNGNIRVTSGDVYIYVE